MGANRLCVSYLGFAVGALLIHGSVITKTAYYAEVNTIVVTYCRLRFHNFVTQLTTKGLMIAVKIPPMGTATTNRNR
jgi:hypothetical protein